MDSSGRIHQFETEEEKKKVEKENGELIELTHEIADKLQALPEDVRQAFYKAAMSAQKKTRDGSFTKPKFNKDKVRKKNKSAKAARKKNR